MHPPSEQTKNLWRLSELSSIDLAPSLRMAEPSSPACHPSPAAEMTGRFTYGTDANDARGVAGEGSQPFHMAYQPGRSFHTGPSARREGLVNLKAFQTEYLLPARSHCPLCSFHRVVRHSDVYTVQHLTLKTPPTLLIGLVHERTVQLLLQHRNYMP